MKLVAHIVFLAMFSLPALRAAGPGWWTDPATRIVDAESMEDNYAPANLGQLKYVAKQAKGYLDARFLGGSGQAISELVAGFSRESQPGDVEGNYSPLNIGQLKAVAKIFYDRLLEGGYDTRANLIARGYPSDWPHDYPWAPQSAVSENYAPANLGQLKLVFSFDLSHEDNVRAVIPKRASKDLREKENSRFGD